VPEGTKPPKTSHLTDDIYEALWRDCNHSLPNQDVIRRIAAFTETFSGISATLQFAAGVLCAREASGISPHPVVW